MEYDGYKVMMVGIYYGIIVEGKRVPVHRYVWEKHNGVIPSKMVIHHKDGDRFNNDIDNIELLTYTEHKRIHAGWTKSKGEWYAKPCKVCGELKPLTEFYRQGKIWQSKCKPCWDEASAAYVAKNKAQVKRNKLRSYHRNKAKKSLSPYQVEVLDLIGKGHKINEDTVYGDGVRVGMGTINSLIAKGFINDDLSLNPQTS